MNSFRRHLAKEGVIACPGVFDALSALLAEGAGFEAVFLSGSALSYSSLGRPDIGLVTASELVDAAARIADRVATPLLVDADGGLGGVAHVDRLVRQLERAGAAAVQIEDQAEVKPANKLTSRPLIPLEAMVGKIKTAQDARINDNFLISARTDAAVSVSFDEALRRAEAYVEAGCDLLFVEGIKKSTEMEEVGKRFGGKVALVQNIFKGGPSPVMKISELGSYGFSVGLFSGAIISTMIKAAQRMLGELKGTEDLEKVSNYMLDNADMVETIGAGGFLSRFTGKG